MNHIKLSSSPYIVIEHFNINRCDISVTSNYNYGTKDKEFSARDVEAIAEARVEPRPTSKAHY